jgi:hypothetical protein
MSGLPLAGKRARIAASVTVVAMATGVALSGSAAGSSDSVAALSAAKAPLSQLHQTDSVTYKGVTITRYEQTIDGIPVINGEVSVMSAPEAAPTVVGDGTSQLPAAAKTAATTAKRISAAQAIAIARSATGAAGLRARPTAALAIDPKRGAVVRRVELASSRPMKDFEVLVDATTGDVLSTRNRLQDATAHAKLYTPNPIANNGGSYSGIGTSKKADHNDKDTAKLTSLRKAVTFNVKSGQHCLVGADVNARVGKGKGKPVCKSSLNWKGVTRSNNKFEALEAYDQISQVADFYRALGFTGSADPHPDVQKIIADNFPDDNSFYSPNDRKIRYGTGGVDDAEDGDVVTHEYGHAVQDAQDRGFGSTDEAGALGEGFGDYQSTLNLLLSPVTPTAKQAFCIFDWDGTSGYGGPGVKPCGRLATGEDGTNTYNQAKSTCSLGHGREEVHCLGEVWSHGLIDLLGNLPLQSGVPPIPVDVILSQFGYADNETFKQAVNGLVAADTTAFGGADVAAICAEMKGDRGINASSCP